MTEVHLDFETRSSKNIKHGAWAYSKHHDTQIMCTCFAVDDGPVQTIRNLEEGFDKTEEWKCLKLMAYDPSVIFTAHNAAFEYAILKNLMGLDIPVERWRCTAALSAYYSLPRALGDVAKALGLDKLKDEAGKKTMLRMCKPVQKNWREKKGYWHEDPKDYKVLVDYCIDDVECERALAKALGQLPKGEQKLWELDQKINLRGLTIDMDLCKAALEMREEVDARLTQELYDLTGLRPSQSKKIAEWVGVESLAKEKLPALIAGEEEDNKRRVLEIRDEFANASLAKYQTALNWAVDGNVKGTLMYHGAKTGRWTGKGVQFQNVPQGALRMVEWDDQLGQDLENKARCNMLRAAIVNKMPELIVSCEGIDGVLQGLKAALRGMIIAPEGMELAALDFAQIEPRFLAWLSQDEDKLDVFRRGEDIYKHTAAGMNKCTVEEVDKKLRAVGKLAVLSLGYQTGAKTLKYRAWLMGIDLTLEECKTIVRKWRESNPKITGLWDELDTLAKYTVRRGKPTKTESGLIQFRMNGPFLQMVLPNGRCMNYYRPAVERFNVKLDEGDEFEVENVCYYGSDSQAGIKYGKIAVRGSMFVQNATQAGCRDLLVHSMFQFEKRGIENIMTVHDEVLVQFAKGKYTLDELLAIMNRKPRWASDIPVVSDGFISNRYRK